MDNWYNEGGYLPPPRVAVWVEPIEECSKKYHVHEEHDILQVDLTRIHCPGLGIKYEDE